MPVGIHKETYLKCELNIEQRGYCQSPFLVGTGTLGAGGRGGNSSRRYQGPIIPHPGREGSCGSRQTQDDLPQDGLHEARTQLDLALWKAEDTPTALHPGRSLSASSGVITPASHQGTRVSSGTAEGFLLYIHT